MKDIITMNVIKAMFDLEISNSFAFESNELTIILKDGSVAKITTKKVA